MFLWGLINIENILFFLLASAFILEQSTWQHGLVVNWRKKVKFCVDWTESNATAWQAVYFSNQVTKLPQNYLIEAEKSDRKGVQVTRCRGWQLSAATRDGLRCAWIFIPSLYAQWITLSLTVWKSDVYWWQRKALKDEVKHTHVGWYRELNVKRWTEKSLYWTAKSCPTDKILSRVQP